MQQSEIQSIKQKFSIIGVSPALNRAIDVAVQVANTDLSVLITGESGVGKEIFPQIIHQYSHRKHNPYIAVNCGAIPEGTIDSELFGHEKGSFTSASSERKGYFEVADGGTIFLDEVGELPLQTQVRLLRVLEAGEFMRVGSSKVQKTNVRVVAATNLNIPQAISQGRFREDLYYRLNAVPISIPPLRERKEDIVLLFRKFAADFAENYRMPLVKLTPEAQNFLKNYYWKGNIRQLKNVTEQISVIEHIRDIDEETLKKYLTEKNADFLPAISNGNFLDEKSFNSEREILYQVLFDMKKDIADLKKLVNLLSHNENIDYVNFDERKPPFSQHNIDNEFIQIVPTSQQPQKSKIADSNEVEDTEEYIEESLSLVDAEKDMIIKALERHRGKRKYAAQDLKISERTLYRKIKEYDLMVND
ncbi:MAG: sigma-54 dependent transcriptional regulator [Prevotellaceae bacterium]|jgi:transcriptional regulator with PAS, ATPase and Fis domain|nr:sigma-54 dependent transcriptional regulator [Prevotellaceae bacterium]